MSNQTLFEATGLAPGSVTKRIIFIVMISLLIISMKSPCCAGGYFAVGMSNGGDSDASGVSIEFGGVGDLAESHRYSAGVILLVLSTSSNEKYFTSTVLLRYIRDQGLIIEGGYDKRRGIIVGVGFHF